MIRNFKELIDIWPSLIDFSRETGVPYPTVGSMRRRNSIDSKYWVRVVSAAQERGFTQVTFELLSQLAASKEKVKAGEDAHG